MFFSGRNQIICIIVIVVLILAGLAGFLGWYFTREDEDKPEQPDKPDKPPSLGGPYPRQAVATDTKECSRIGNDTLARNGSAVDAAIAAMFCLGVINMHIPTIV